MSRPVKEIALSPASTRDALILPRFFPGFGIHTLLASFFGLMAMNAAFDTSPKVLHIQRVIGKETRVFFRPRGDGAHESLVVGSWRTPGAFQAVIVTNDLWRKARTARSSLEIETRKGWLGYEYLTRDAVLVSAP